MVPIAAFAMLACARIGAIHSVVFGGFAAKELANRIDDSLPKLIITCSSGLEPGKIIKYAPIVDEALGFAEKLQNATELPRLIWQRKKRADSKFAGQIEDLNVNPDFYHDFNSLYG